MGRGGGAGWLFQCLTAESQCRNWLSRGILLLSVGRESFEASVGEALLAHADVTVTDTSLALVSFTNMVCLIYSLLSACVFTSCHVARLVVYLCTILVLHLVGNLSL